MKNNIVTVEVSTHSHPKVAAFGDKIDQKINYSFNTQPPEGGCFDPCIGLVH